MFDDPDWEQLHVSLKQHVADMKRSKDSNTALRVCVTEEQGNISSSLIGSHWKTKQKSSTAQVVFWTILSEQ